MAQVHYFLAAFGHGIGASVTISPEEAAGDLRRLIDDACNATFGRFPEGVLASVAPRGVMLAFPSGTPNHAVQLCEAVQSQLERAIRTQIFVVPVCAVITFGPMRSVDVLGYSSNFEGRSAIAAARVLAKMQSGRLAVEESAWEFQTLARYLGESERLPGKHVDEAFSIRVHQRIIFPSLEVAPSEPSSQSSEQPTFQTLPIVNIEPKGDTKPQYTPYLWDVFLSYNGYDKTRVQRLAERLRDVGLRVWFDAWVIEPGDNIDTAIEHGLEYSRTLVLCMSRAAFGSDWVKLERNTTLFRNPQNIDRRFTPLLLEDCHIPDTIHHFRYVDWRDENDGELARLIQECRPPANSATVNQPVDPNNIAPPGGAIRHDSPFYIERAADAEVIAAARRTAGTLIIKAPRQMGKSSLLKRYLAECYQANKQTMLLDLSMFTDGELADYPTFLTRLAEAMWKKLGQPPQAVPSSMHSQATMIDFIGDILLAAVPRQVVVAFDEADKLLGRTYQADFFSMVRHWHERRTDTPPTAWERVSLVLVVSTEPYLLINDALRSPFNVGLEIKLSPFNEAECHELNRRYNGCLCDAEVAQLMDLLGGHPYLTQLAYYHLTCQRPMDLPTLLRDAAERYGPFGLHLRAMEHKLGDETNQTLLAAMRQVVHGGTMLSRDVFYRLHGAGLVCEEGGSIVPANHLYARFFGGLQ